MTTAITRSASDQQIGNGNSQTALTITDIEIPRLEIENLKWNTPQETQNSIIKLYQYTEKNALKEGSDGEYQKYHSWQYF